MIWLKHCGLTILFSGRKKPTTHVTRKPINYGFIFIRRILLSREKCLSVFAVVEPLKGLDDSRAHQCILACYLSVLFGVTI